MKRLGQHPACGTYLEEASLCRYCDDRIEYMPLQRFVHWAHEAAWLRLDHWEWYDAKVADYIKRHRVLELTS